MKILKIIAIFLLVGGVALTGLAGYAYFFSEDHARAQRYSADQQRLLAEAANAQGTPRERELMKEYEEGKSVTELAWEHARQTRQTTSAGSSRRSSFDSHLRTYINYLPKEKRRVKSI